MAKIHFFYSCMNAGKTTHLLQANYNYVSDGFKTFLIKPEIDNRFDTHKITSRIGIEADAFPLKIGQSIKNLILDKLKNEKIDIILADEVQFFTKEQVKDLAYVADVLGITVMAYGLRTDFQGNLFDGTKAFFEIANNLTEIKRTCHCGDKATMVLRYDNDGNVIKEGEQIVIGAEECYVSVCRKHFFENNIGSKNKNFKKA